MTSQAARGYSPGWRGATRVFLPPLIRAVMKRDWRGRENLPREGGVILAPNHISYADWAAVAVFTHEAGRYPAFLIKAGVFDVALAGPLLRRLGQLPVHRGRADAALVLRDAERSLREGECIIVYPEGTVTRDPALWPMVAKTGVARLALATGVPVIPLAHWGTQDILPYGSRRPRLLLRPAVRMLAGPAVDLHAYAGQPLTREVLRTATEVIMADITGLLAQLRDEPPPPVRYDPAARERTGSGPAVAPSRLGRPHRHGPGARPSRPAARETGERDHRARP